MKTINHYLASANTGEGFVNHFQYINDLSKPAFMYILKGGPGTGKSTMLRKIGEYFFENGEPVEYFYCSSDPSSLDGVRLSSHNIAIVDGTSPHTTEAKLPSVTEKIYNLGDCIFDEIAKHRDKLLELSNEKQQLFKQVYKYLSIAKESMLSNVKGSRVDFSQGEALLKKLELKSFDKTGSTRHLFLNFWGQKGKASLAKLNTFEKTFIIDGNILSIDANMKMLSSEALRLGYDVVMFHNILLPEFVSSIFLPQLNIFISSREKEDSQNDTLLHKQTSIEYQKLACKTLKQTRTIHSEIEKYYINNIDFDELNRITAKIIGNIENRIENTSNA